MKGRAVLVLLLAVAGCGDSVEIVPGSPPPPAAPAAVAVTVESGSGSGSYAPGDVVAIEAAAAAAGEEFDRWAGDVGTLADPAAARTLLTVPARAATVRATYRTLPAPPPPPPPPGDRVTASVETDPVPSSGDAADDPCVWIHPDDPAQSTIIATDKNGGYLLVYDLSGAEIHRLNTGDVNNVDLRYGFPLDGDRVALVTATDRSNDTIACFRVDPATRDLVPLGAIDSGLAVYGHCLYRSVDTGDTYAFVTAKSGDVEQWRLFDDGAGGVDGTLVRTFDVGGVVEGCVADDELARFYAAEEGDGIWRYGAEPGAGASRTLVDGTGSAGHLVADVEGLAIYYAGDGTGYLIASSQGADEYAVYEREGDNAFVMTFRIEEGVVDGTEDTDGLDVTNAALGPDFPHGLLVVQDGRNGGSRQNFKLVPWERVAFAASPTLTIDTSWDPRTVGD